MEKCNVAIVGYGGMASCWHVPHLLAMPDRFDLCGIYDIADERRKIARANGILRMIHLKSFFPIKK